MNTGLTVQQIDSYRDNGFVLIENFLDASELELWRAAVDDAVTRRGSQRILGQATDPAKKKDDYYDNVFIQRVNLWQSHEGIARLMLDERIGRMAADLEGIDGIRVWHDQALIKQPWGNPTSWHLDNPYWSFSSPHAISIWIALDDVTMQNGCLYFLPGTHKTARYDNVGIGPNLRDLFRHYPDWAKMQPVAVPMKAGSCSFHNGLTAHAAGPNMTLGYRRAMTCAFMPDGATFNGQRNIFTEEQMARLKVGDVLADDAQNPLLFSRRKSAARPA